MKIVRDKQDDDRYILMRKDGSWVAYITKNYVGTSGNWRGYKHYVFCPEMKSFMWAGVLDSFIYQDTKEEDYKTWSEAPAYFRSLKEFKKYYSMVD